MASFIRRFVFLAIRFGVTNPRDFFSYGDHIRFTISCRMAAFVFSMACFTMLNGIFGCAKMQFLYAKRQLWLCLTAVFYPCSLSRPKTRFQPFQSEFFASCLTPFAMFRSFGFASF